MQGPGYPPPSTVAMSGPTWHSYSGTPGEGTSVAEHTNKRFPDSYGPSLYTIPVYEKLLMF